MSGGKRCADQECAVCSRSQKGNCWKESVGYEISCLDCAEGGDRYVYIGETGRTAKVRCGEHLDDLEKRKGSLWPHCRDVHGGRPVAFRSEVIACFRNPLDRQLNEAWRIRNEEGVLLNRKEEWLAPADVTIRVERG